MKKYRSHKVIEAAKIVSAMPNVATLVLQDFDDGPRYMQSVKFEYFTKYKPTPGGYYTRHGDGHEGYCPGAPFESGYSEVTE